MATSSDTFRVGSKVVYLAGVILVLRFVDLGPSGVIIASIAGSLLVIGGSLRVILR